ncbi:monocarboxylate transporter 12-like [Haliotis rufescens]|uniref:monocarboxylate transporter 12-like n=1 Tax=Haliotis rufescens TaxID=6454 RepID=UPI00201E7A9D|nr:monocarboxylate transporter 12-like [Haliotis rufescens]XP_046374555.2 monocarboxylate transporter 12-like [Haliotis rufescens]
MANHLEPWAWVVVVTSLCALFLNTSLSVIAGVMHVALLETYQDDVTLTSWIGSLYSCMFALSGPVASFIINRWNCRCCVIVSGVLGLAGFALSSLASDIRWLFLTYALMAGLGQGLCYTGCLVLLGFYFKNQTSLATGIGIVGCGLGNFLLPPLTQWLLDGYGLKGTFLLLGALSFQSCVCGSLMRPPLHERTRHQAERKAGHENLASRCQSCFNKARTCSKPIFLNTTFSLYLLSVMSFTIGCSTLKLYLPDFVMKQGATFQHASSLVSVIGVGSILSRVCLGFAATEPKIGPSLLYSGTNGLTAVLVYLIYPLTRTSMLRVIFSFCYGVYNGGNWTLFSPITYTVVGVDHLASATGLVMFTCGMGYLIGGPIAGMLLEATGNYHTAFMFSASSFLLTSIFGLLMTCARSRPPDSETSLTTTLPEREALTS